MSNHEYIKSVTDIIPDDFPSLTPLPESGSSNLGMLSYITNITWQTWVIIILILALLGINIFAYLAKGTEETANIFQQIFGPLLKLFGYATLTTTKQTVQNAATGTKAGVDIIANTTTDTIDTIQETAMKNNAGAPEQNDGVPISTTGTSTGLSYPQGQPANSSLPVQYNIQQGERAEKWQRDSLVRALDNAKQTAEQVTPDDSRSSIQTTGKSGWCYIGEEQGIRSCSEIGVNDVCMSGDVFPTQAVCMNPSLRA